MKSDFNQAFLQLDFYGKHEYMIPFVGDYYDSSDHKKLLLLGESHYLPKESEVCIDETKWYNNKVDLQGDDYDYCNTQNTWKGGNTPFHKNVRESLYSIFKCNDPWEHVAFCNYFLRPVLKGDEFKPGVEDSKQAINNLINVVNILKPNLIVFLSKKAVESAEKYYKKSASKPASLEELWDWTKSEKIEYCYTNHPSRSWDSLMPKEYWRDKWNLLPKDLSASNFFYDWLETRL